MRIVTFFSLCISLFASGHVLAQGNDSLTISSKAPNLNIEHWLTNGNGKFKQIKEFEQDKVYVVEFWATWCGPCIMTMPHLVEVQKRFADKNVQVISISDESLETVQEFLGQTTSGGEGETYASLTSAYCLTTDPDQSSHRDYMYAARQQGIPASFIVGKTGLIEWIGHPAIIDEPLQKVVDGTWDREAYKKERELEVKRTQVIQSLTNQASAFAKSDEIAKGLLMLETALKEHSDDPILIAQIQSLILRLKTASPFSKIKSGKVEEANSQLSEILQSVSEEERGQIMIAKCNLLTTLYADTNSNEQHLADSLKKLHSMKGISSKELYGVVFNILHSLDDQKNLHPSIVDAAFRCCEKILATNELVELQQLDTYCQFAILKGDRGAAVKAIEKAKATSSKEQRSRLERLLKEIQKPI